MNPIKVKWHRKVLLNMINFNLQYITFSVDFSGGLQRSSGIGLAFINADITKDSINELIDVLEMNREVDLLIAWFLYEDKTRPYLVKIEYAGKNPSRR